MNGEGQFESAGLGAAGPGAAGLGAVLKTALDAVVVMTPDGVIAGWNDVATRSFGWSEADALGRRMSEIIIPERYREAHERGLAHYLATGEGPVLDRHIEIEALHRDGRELPVELSITRTEQFGAPVFLGFLRDITERREAARRQELLIGELNHRVKNVLGVVGAMADQTARNSSTIEAFTDAFGGRLAAFGRAHEILTAGTWEHGSLLRFAEELFAGHREGREARVTIAGDDVPLAPRQLISTAMILHELFTNSVKYGALGAPRGTVELRLGQTAGIVAIEWIERGLAGIAPPTGEGFGSKMIRMNVRHELRGELAQDWRDDGLHLRLTFPTAAEAGA